MKWVVVGAGSGGCVAARRLCDAGHRVVLVEGGPALDPGGVPPAIDGDDCFAALEVEGRIYDDLMARRTAGGPEARYLRGRGVGGSSAVNAMVAFRGDPARYHSWGWDDVEAAWARCLIPVERPEDRELGRTDRLLLEADHDAEIAPLTRRAGRRVTSAEAYLWPLRAHQVDRFEVRTEEAVDRVSFDGGGAATGVVLSNGDVIGADAVVLAAGAIHTPAILQRSGVDRRRHGPPRPSGRRADVAPRRRRTNPARSRRPRPGNRGDGRAGADPGAVAQPPRTVRAIGHGDAARRPDAADRGRRPGPHRLGRSASPSDGRVRPAREHG